MKTGTTFKEITNKTGKLVQDNSPAILTAIGVTGLAVTAYLTGKATFKASTIINDEQHKEFDNVQGHYLDNKEKFKLVWKEYVPAAVTGVLTASCIIGANRIGTRRAAAMTAAYAISERAYSEYKDKVIETIGKSKETKVRDEIAQDRVKANPPVDGQIIMVNSGEQMFMDAYSGRYFQSTMEDVKAAQNSLNHEVLNQGYASLSDLYGRLGLSNTKSSDDVGWNNDKLLEMTFSAAMTEDNRSCVVMDFIVAPVRSFFRNH